MIQQNTPYEWLIKYARKTLNKQYKLKIIGKIIL